MNSNSHVEQRIKYDYPESTNCDNEMFNRNESAISGGNLFRIPTQKTLEPPEPATMNNQQMSDEFRSPLSSNRNKSASRKRKTTSSNSSVFSMFKCLGCCNSGDSMESRGLPGVDKKDLKIL